MPINCGISNGIDVSCEDLRKPGGLYRDVWVGNLSDLRVPFPVEEVGYMTTIEMLTYMGLYRFSSTKFSHEATWTEQLGEGGNVSYLQTVVLRLFNSTPEDDRAIEDLGVSEVFVITRSNAGEYLIWGAESGLSAGDGTQGGLGRQSTDSTASEISLQGAERFLPKRLLIGGTSAATLAALNAMTA